MQDLTFNVYASHVLWLEVITNLVLSCKVVSKDQQTSAQNEEEQLEIFKTVSEDLHIDKICTASKGKEGME